MDEKNLQEATNLVERKQKLQRLLTDIECGHNMKAVTLSHYIGRTAQLDLGSEEITRDMLEQIKLMCVTHLKSEIASIDKRIREL
jgi:hypothetical protein